MNSVAQPRLIRLYDRPVSSVTQPRMIGLYHIPVSSVAQPQLIKTAPQTSQQCCTASADQDCTTDQSAVLHSLIWSTVPQTSQQCCTASYDQTVPQTNQQCCTASDDQTVPHTGQQCCTASADQAVSQTTIQHIEQRAVLTMWICAFHMQSTVCRPKREATFLSSNNEVDNAWPHCAVYTQVQLTINPN